MEVTLRVTASDSARRPGLITVRADDRSLTPYAGLAVSVRITDGEQDVTNGFHERSPTQCAIGAGIVGTTRMPSACGTWERSRRQVVWRDS